MSFYADQKKSEILHSYSHIHQIPMTIFRFFTVYGPWEDLIWLYSNLQKQS